MNNLETILFFVFAFVTVLGGAVIIITKNIIHAVVGLFFSLLGVAALYVFASADVLAVIQLLVYAGGVLVLIVFGVMLTNRSGPQDNVTTSSANHFLSFLLLAPLAGFLIYWILDKPMVPFFNETGAQGGIKPMGISIMSDFGLPFEILAIVLLVALIGAGAIAMEKTKKTE